MKRYIQNLDENTAIQLSKEFNDKEFQNQETCTLIFADNITCSPFGMLVSGNTIKNFRKTNPNNKFIAKLNSGAQGISYAGHMGFFKMISEELPIGKLPGEANGSDNYIPITKVDFKNYRNSTMFKYMETLNYIEYESKNLAKVLCQNNNDLQKLFSFLIREMIRNCEEHAEVQEAWICAQNWKSRNEAEICILDNGIGYKNSLTKKYGKKIINDEMAIRYALQPGISESYFSKYMNENDNSGFGLYMASEICDMLNGSFSVMSGDSLLKKQNGSIITKNANYNGAIITLKINTSNSFSYTELLNRVSTKGEKQLKDSRKASELSKGKFVIN